MAKYICPFKIGDIIKPIAGKKTSSDVPLLHLKLLEVKSLRKNYNGRQEVEVKIIKGHYKFSWSNNVYKEGSTVTMFAEAFELADPAEPEYDIY